MGARRRAVGALTAGVAVALLAGAVFAGPVAAASGSATVTAGVSGPRPGAGTTAGASAAAGRGHDGASALGARDGGATTHGMPLGGPDPDLRLARRVPGSATTETVATTPVLSVNWSGEVERGTGFTSVSGAWAVPSVGASARSPGVGYSSAWVGIGGDPSTPTATGEEGLIQVGTSQIFTTGTAHYGAWFEVLPTEPAIGFGGPVHAGDPIAASITQGAGSTWHIEIQDSAPTNRWTRSLTVTYPVQTTTSAEWIVEAPIVSGDGSPGPLAQYGSVHFTSLASTSADAAGVDVSPVLLVTDRYTGKTTPTTAKVISYPEAVGTSPGTDFTDTYGTPVPTVTSLTPPRDAPSGGLKVTVHGTWLVLTRSVLFGTTPARITGSGFSIGPTGASSQVVFAPPEPDGTVAVTVVTNDATTAVSPGDDFTYATPPPTGYDLAGADGGVFVFPPPGTDTGFYGSLPALDVTPARPIVGMVPTLDDEGYILVGSDGGVFSFGDAPFLGSLPGDGVSVDDITGIVASDTDHGYLLVGRDGGVFAFGAAAFLGSLPGRGVVTDDIVGIASTPTGDGYWLVSSSGAVYGFGVAAALGTTAGATSAIAGTPTGGGYWLVGADGAVAAYGIATDFGTLPHDTVVPSEPVIGIVPTAGTGGYWLVGADGGIFAFGDAGFAGSLPQDGVQVDDVVGAVPIGG